MEAENTSRAASRPFHDFAATLTDLEPFGRGGWYKGLCPLRGCTGEDDSFTLFDDGGSKATFQCWECDRSGDPLDFRALVEADGPEPRENGHGEEIYSSVYRVGVADERKTLRFRTAREIAAETPAKVDWLARPWIARGAITEVDGKIKAAGKTTFVSHQVACIVDGRGFMGEPTKKTKVVWLTEQSPATFRKVLERANLTDCGDVIVLHWHDAMGMKWEDVARAAADKALEIGAGLLVVDTLGQFAGIKGDGENNAGAAQEAMQPLQEAAAKGLAVLFTRHERKGGGEVGESGRGSSAFGGAVDVILSLRRGEGNTRPTVRIIESLSRFDETPDKVVVELTENGYRNLGDASAFAEREARDAIVEMLPAKSEHAIPTADVLDRLGTQGVKRTVATDALAALTTAGTIERLGKGQKGSPYRYYKPTPEDRPGDSESPDSLDDILSSATPTLIRTKENEQKNTADGTSRSSEGGAKMNPGCIIKLKASRGEMEHSGYVPAVRNIP